MLSASLYYKIWISDHFYRMEKYAVLAANQNQGLHGIAITDILYSIWNTLINPDVYLGNIHQTSLKFYCVYPCRLQCIHAIGLQKFYIHTYM